MVGCYSHFLSGLFLSLLMGTSKSLVVAYWLFLVFGVGLTLISALTSANTGVSLWGRGFVIDSFATTLVLALFAFLVATFAREQRKLIKLFLAAFSGSVVAVLLQVVLFLSHTNPFVTKYFGHVASQGALVGSWVDFAHFVTFTFLLSLLMFEVLMPKGFFRFLSLSAMILSVVALAFLNFKTAWVIAIIAALLVFVYKSSVERSLKRFFISSPEGESAPLAEQARFPIMSFVALLVGLFFFLSSSSIGASLARVAGVNFADIRPSLSATTQVMRASLAHDPLFGAGAGRFADVWNLYHPVAVNQTIFWNTSFDAGFSITGLSDGLCQRFVDELSCRRAIFHRLGQKRRQGLARHAGECRPERCCQRFYRPRSHEPPFAWPVQRPPGKTGFGQPLGSTGGSPHANGA